MKIIVSSAGQSKFLRISLVDKVLSVGHWWTRTFPNNHQQLLRWSTRHYSKFHHQGKKSLKLLVALFLLINTLWLVEDLYLSGMLPQLSLHFQGSCWVCMVVF
ncbi:uncharacterized protein LOC113322130 isoform X2 [Papaver somniferum]|uniref:uncharacterized protein LOC113322130 isoform X2 n=1 Tax=Papaver somniferum TaxID=3469 RepID=UPI000E6F5008|nr:uncharacterized protein LOC113322130 isoform X2 [Papaver somniferum]XP_026425943.1 uncharacterized protein LOC113322130 isoform X2 [Papaver somniferum]XP_026425948.1 uncharacterized protein LOC113322130 isoform X2 [Papaver somniferum]